MNKDKEPILSDFPLAHDDLTPRHRTAHAATGKTANTPPLTEPPPSNGSNGVAVFALTLALVLAGGAIFLFLQLQDLQQSFAKAQQKIQEQNENANLLNERLSVSGENTTLSMGSIQAKNNEQDSEIRKLWDLSGKRNRSAIEANTKAISAVQAEDKKRQAELASLQQKVGQLAELDKRIKTAEKRLLDITELELRLAQQQEATQQSTKDIQALSKDLKKATQDNDKLRKQLDEQNVRLNRLQGGAGQ